MLAVDKLWAYRVDYVISLVQQ